MQYKNAGAICVTLMLAVLPLAESAHAAPRSGGRASRMVKRVVRSVVPTRPQIRRGMSKARSLGYSAAAFGTLGAVLGGGGLILNTVFEAVASGFATPMAHSLLPAKPMMETPLRMPLVYL